MSFKAHVWRNAALALCGIMAVLALAFALSPSAFATSTELQEQPDNGVAIAFGNDYLWAGESTTISNRRVDNDLLAAGRSITVEGADVNGSVRIAGQTVELDNVDIQENATIAGETVIIEDSEATAAWMAGRTARFSGTCTELEMYADTVVLNGRVDGDARIGANSVEIGPDAVVTGTLHVSSSAQPSVSESAKINDIDVTIEEKEDSSADTESMLGSLSITGIILTVIWTIVVAVFAEWLLRKQTKGAAEMIRNRTGATIGSGIIGALAAPAAAFILCCLVITLPIAGILVLALLAMTCAATGFMGASVFKLIFPKLNRFVTAIIGGTIMGILSALPIVGGIVVAIAFFYVLGYALQSIFLSIKKEKPQPSIPAPGIPAPAFADAEVPAPPAESVEMPAPPASDTEMQN